MTESSSEVGKNRKAECSQCGGQRNCDIRGHHHTIHSEQGFWGRTDWYILQCRGCDYVFAQTDVRSSEEYNQYYDEDGEEQCEMAHTYSYWPALSKRARPEWMGEYGLTGVNGVDALDTAMMELYGALNSNLPMLSAIGIRTCFDVASEVLEVDPAFTFAEKLDALVETKRIREVDRERLETAVEAGNASAHRGWKPEPNDLATMMTILEHFVFDAFVQPNRRKQLDEDALKVKGTVPPKPPRRKKSKGDAPAVAALPASVALEHLEIQK